MKYVNIGFCALMVLFAAVQYNDPDALVWVPIYLIPAVCAGLAAFRLQSLRGPLPRLLLTVCLVLAIAGTVYYWPRTPGFWRMDVWWETETAREGMGMMLVALVIGVALLTVAMDAARNRRHGQGENSELST